MVCLVALKASALVRRLSQINLNALRVAESVARHGNLTRAAEESCITPSAVSQQISKLEQQLEFKIFNRRHRSLALTLEGEAFILSVRQSLDQIIATHNQLTNRERVGILKISVLPTFAIRWLLPRLNRFQAKHPEFQVHISHSYRAVDFRREDFDLAVRYGCGRFKGLAQHLLFKEDLVPVCAPTLIENLRPGKQPSDIKPGDLKDFTLLHSGTCTANWRCWLEKVGAREVLEQSASMYFDSCLLSFQAANAGLGFAVANRAYVADDLKEGRLIAPFDLALPSGNGWHLVYPEAHAEYPRILAFQDWICEEVRRGGPVQVAVR